MVESTDESSSIRRYVNIYIGQPLRFLVSGAVAIGNVMRNVFGMEAALGEFDPVALMSENNSDVVVVSDMVRVSKTLMQIR